MRLFFRPDGDRTASAAAAVILVILVIILVIVTVVFLILYFLCGCLLLKSGILNSDYCCVYAEAHCTNAAFFFVLYA